MSWRRLGLLIRGLPRESRTAHAQHGDRVTWGAAEHLLAAVFDALAVGNWQRSQGKGQRPKPIKRPGQDNETRYGKAIPIEEARVRLAARRRGA